MFNVIIENIEKEHEMIFGIALPALVVLLIEILKKVGIVKTGDQARFADIVLSGLGAIAISLIAEFDFSVAPFVIVVVGALYSIIVSALGYTAGEKVVLAAKQ